jgi:hypothetical protein
MKARNYPFILPEAQGLAVALFRRLFGSGAILKCPDCRGEGCPTCQGQGEVIHPMFFKSKDDEGETKH